MMATSTTQYSFDFSKKVEFKQNGIFFVVFILFFGWSFSQEPSNEKISVGGLKRLYKLNDSVYRSEQPTKKEFGGLEAMGIKTVINFRRGKKDDKKARKTRLNLKHLPLKTKELTKAHLVIALKMINSSEKPVLLHCWHGSDRTGAVSAAYRIIFENWDKEEAIKELRKDEFGYHENWYPNVIGLLRELDVTTIKQELNIK